MRPILLFLKALLPGHAADLFATPTQVEGYVTKQGTYVAPTTAIRHKKREAPRPMAHRAEPVPKPAQADLFAAGHKPAPAQADLFAGKPQISPQKPPETAPNPPKPEKVNVAVPEAPQLGGGFNTADLVEADGFGETPRAGIVTRVFPRDVMVRWTGGSGGFQRLPFDRVQRTGKSGCPIKGTGKTALNDALDVFAAGSREHMIADCLDHQLTSGNPKIGTEAHALLQDGTSKQIWALIRHLRDTLDVASEWGEVRRAATRYAAELAKPPVESPPQASDGAESPAPVKQDAPPEVESKPSVESEPAQFGVEAGIKPAARRKLNAAAVALLNAKRDADMTAADKQVLAQYSGTGGCGESLNEYYTPVPVAEAMWDLLARAGFRGGDVLEPSAGTGVFLRTAPAGARVQAVELDPISSRIAGILHPQHSVECASLERFATQDGRLFDAVIGNPPFGARGALVSDDKPKISSAEDYFLDTMLDKTRDGGLVAAIVPSTVMDSKNGRSFRERLLRKGEFLGASRMPNTAFEGSNTDVTTDVLLFRKRPQEAAGALRTLDQDQLQAVGVWDDEFLSGAYFEGRGRDNLHGSVGTVMRMHGPAYSVIGSMVGVPEAVRDMPVETPPPTPSMPDILAALGDDEYAKDRAIAAALKPPYQVAKPGDVRVVNGIRYILQGEPPRWHRAEEDLTPAVAEALKLAELLDDLHEDRARDPIYTRLQLQEALGEWVGKHGAPGRNKHLRQWLQAPSMPNEDGAEANTHGDRVKHAARRAARLLGAVNDDGSYSDLVTGHTRQTDPLSLETLATTLSLENGHFSPDQLAVASRRPISDVLDFLHASPAYAVEPDGRTWSTLDAYVAGDLWAKFDAASAAAAAADADPTLAAKWRMQAEALEAAIAPKSLEDVEISFGSGFIQPADINAWLRTTAAGSREKPPILGFSEADAIWEVSGSAFGDADLILRSLNRTGVKKDERETLARLDREFGDWLRTSDRRDQVEERYNRLYRGFRARDYSDAPIAIPGMVTDGLKAFQYSGVRWALEAGSGCIAADVGLGKTVRGLMLARLLQTTGEAKQPVIVVPKSVLANWLAEVEKWFPGTKVLTIGETYSRDKLGNLRSKSDNEATRREKWHQLQQNTFDFVLVSQPAWNALDIDPDKKEELRRRDFWNRRGEALEGASAKKINKLSTDHEQEMAERDFRDREQTIVFDELGIDALLLDEGHAYKNLYQAKQRWGNSPKFLGGQGKSNRALDTNFKTAILRERTGGKGIFMLTATPTANSPLEVYSTLAHIAPQAFERMGIKNAEEFIDRFCEFQEEEILTPSGELKDMLVTTGFKNLDELREVMKRYIDRKTAEDVGLVIPTAEHHEHYVDMTAAQEATYQGLREMARPQADGGTGDGKGKSHIFSIMDQMGKAALDLGLLTGQTDGADAPKIDTCVAEAIKRSADGNQIIFCDHNEMHEKIAARLVAAGIPRSQIGILNADETGTGAARQKVCDAVNSGRMPFVIGNTKVMGEGVNLQKGTSDIHHLDLGWNPAIMQQRNGRGVRQGNSREAVRVHTYLAKKSFDGYRLQNIRAKKNWLDLLWNGGDRVENLAYEGAEQWDPNIMFAVDAEAAAEKRANDLEAAKVAKRAAERGRAIDQFNRYNKMVRAVAKLEAENKGGAALVRLKQQAEKARTTLSDMAAFEHKHLLDTVEPTLIEPNTGHVWQKGTGLLLAGGGQGPINYAKDETRWVVSGVNPESRTVYARPFGRLATRSIAMDLEAMKEGATPFEVSDAAERELLEADAAIDPAQAPKGSLGMKELRHMPQAVLARHGEAIQRRLRHAIENYDVHEHVYGVATPTGPVLTDGSGIRHRPADHKLMLPLPEHREPAIDAFVREGLQRKIKLEYPPGRARYQDPTPRDTYPANGDLMTTQVRGNPWGAVLDTVFGRAARAEAEAKLREKVHANVAAAPSFLEAVKAAVPGIVMPGYGKLGDPHHNHWTPELARLLRAKAQEHGALEAKLQDATRGASRWNPEIPNGVLRHEGYDWGNPGAGHRTVGEWLDAIGKKREPKPEMAEAA